MSCNVWEWCSDCYAADYYKNSPANNPAGADLDSFRVLRGGSWNNNAQHCRVAYRNNNTPNIRYNNYNFRFALVP